MLLLSLGLTSTAVASDPEALFNGTCGACHQPGGVGSPGLAPPLADKPLWNRLGATAATYLQGVMFAGLSGGLEIDGQKYSGLVMPPQDRLSDSDLTAIGNYILGTINGLSAPQLTTESVAAARASPATHATLRALRRTGQ